MNPTVSQLWRHPIKGHGRETVTSVTLTAGQCMPWDRHWAVAHDRSKFDPQNPEWLNCGHFMRGANTPELSAISSTWDAPSGVMTVQHPDLGDLRFRPNTEGDAFIKWVKPLSFGERFRPAALVSAPGRGMTDSARPSVSIMSTASHKAAEGAQGCAIDPVRWRGNIWVDGFDAWDEWDWVDKTLRIGMAELTIRKPIERCKQIMANPDTGKRDLDLLDTLFRHWGHRNFGVQALVTKTGDVKRGDPVEVL